MGSSHTSKNMIDDDVNGSVLSDDVLLKILFRLSIKHLFRFKCVSKAWNRLISDAFSRTKLSVTMSGLFYHAYVHPQGVLNKHRYAPVMEGNHGMDTSLGFVPDGFKLRIIDCCNGLLLCHLNSMDFEGLNYYVCNPVTKKWTTLPKPHFKEGSFDNAKLIFNPRVSPHYKVVKFLNQFDRDPTCLELDVFSSETGSWVESNVVHGPEIPCLRSEIQTVLLDGTLFALAYPFHIVGFVVGEEESCRLIKLPVAPMEVLPVERLGVSEGCLHYAYHKGSRLQIWMMRNSASAGEWELRHSSSVRELVLNPLFIKMGYDPIICPHYMRSFPCRFVPLAFHPDSGVVFLGIQGKILAYYLKSKRLEEVCDISFECVYLHWLWVFPFKPCLVDFFDGGSSKIQQST
ncbi:putative F-box protein At1g47790 [Magnolia sinica]|uniref:putative F-box protein At1g47790 n=1 Tax=Magnolia sinica TaxID=86752 RepID=UPI00265868CC|nr:putative F-box protein At1g47790 [Magnolia sinica]